MNCQKIDSIESLKVIFQGPKGLKKVKFGYFFSIYSKAVS